MTARLVYTTDWSERTVTIDYVRPSQQFLTTQERHPFTAERLLRMLNGWAKIGRVARTPLGRLHIAAYGAQCVLTQEAKCALSRLFWQHPDWHLDYPFALKVLACESVPSSFPQRRSG